MNKFKRSLLSLTAVLLLSGGALAVSASAMTQTGSNNSDTSQTSANKGDSSNTGSSGDTTDSKTIDNMENEFRQKAEAEVQTEKTKVKQHTEADREKACDARKNALENRMSNAVKAAARHKAVFDEIYTKVKNFYATKQLNVSNYAALTAAVDSAQANAQASIDTLKALDVSVDCTSQTVATTVATFRQAVKSTHDSLQAYRTALVNLITALKGASTSNATNSSSKTNG